MTLPPAVILAGGRASRMGGGDKVLLTLRGQPLLAHVMARLAPQTGAMAISANGDPARFRGFGLPVLPDSLPDFPGPLAGILAAMDWARDQGAAQVVVVAGDTPFLPADLVARLARAAGPGLALAAAPDADGMTRLHPACAIWPVALRADLARTLADAQGRIRAFAKRHDARTALFEDATQAFFNINTPDDLRRAETLP
ncbi:MAG: molybdenum cofactor guanylyltransferase MobA [Paracoccus sp. (in: a-proteobacteria)]|nr:molybdenum cofactor guanylyltransferase MobA [Paracoccus sp. (in: a-proteobacteria)]